MPEISRFLGMAIKMVFGDHAPPHIHVIDSGIKSKVDFNGNLLTGYIPEHKLNILRNWILEHRIELEENWTKVINDIPPERIKPWQ